MIAMSFELKSLCKNVAFYRRIKIYITNLCTTFDRPKLSASEGCCVFIGHEYIYTYVSIFTVVYFSHICYVSHPSYYFDCAFIGVSEGGMWDDSVGTIGSQFPIYSNSN